MVFEMKMTNLCIFKKFILDAFASRYQVGAIFMDFVKPFDKLSHAIFSNELIEILFSLVDFLYHRQ